jgi:hypothetical protein
VSTGRSPRREPGPADRPWVLRVVVIVALAVLVGGILWASLLGHLF